MRPGCLIQKLQVCGQLSEEISAVKKQKKEFQEELRIWNRKQQHEM